MRHKPSPWCRSFSPLPCSFTNFLFILTLSLFLVSSAWCNSPGDSPYSASMVEAQPLGQHLVFLIHNLTLLMNMRTCLTSIWYAGEDDRLSWRKPCVVLPPPCIVFREKFAFTSLCEASKLCWDQNPIGPWRSVNSAEWSIIRCTTETQTVVSNPATF